MRPQLPLLVLLCLAQFVAVLDGTLVLVALPVIGRDLGLAGGGLQWVVTAYVLVFAGCLLVAGRLADALGRRRVFIAGLALFTAASLACGLAPAAAALVAARAVAGARRRAGRPGRAGDDRRRVPGRAPRASARSRPGRASPPSAARPDWCSAA